MDDTSGVRVGQCVGDLETVAEHRLEWESVARDEVAERPALDQLHDDERLLAFVSRLRRPCRYLDG